MTMRNNAGGQWLEILPIPDPVTGVSRRQAEGDAWRQIVRRRLGEGVTVSYNENGAPVLSYSAADAITPASWNDRASGNDKASGNAPAFGDYSAAPHPGYIGVSHTRGWVAVVWSPEPCAVDIELKTRTISPASAARVGISPDIASWCAWEALYKYRSAGGVETDPRVCFHPHPDLVVAVIL